MAELKRFYSKSLRVNVVADGKSPFYYGNKLAVCTKAEGEAPTVTAYLTLFDVVTRNEDNEPVGVFEVNSKVHELEDVVVVLGDVTATEEKVEEEAAEGGEGTTTGGTTTGGGDPVVNTPDNP